MPRGRTGVEIIRGWLTRQKVVSVEKQFFNPLDAKIGSHARFTNTLTNIRGVPDVDISGNLYKVTEIWAWERSRHGDKLPPFADYILESDDTKLVLRVFTTTSHGKTGDPELLLMTQHWPEMDEPYPWGEDSPHIINGCMDEKGQFTRYLGTPDEQVYFRDLCNVHCKVSRIRDENMDGTVEIEEVSKLDFSLWTFRRDTKDVANQDCTQHLHVQLSGLCNESTRKVNGGDKTIVMLRGESVPALNFTMY